MFCPKCGSEIVDGYKFCPKCGENLENVAGAGGPQINVNQEPEQSTGASHNQQTYQQNQQGQYQQGQYQQYQQTQYQQAQNQPYPNPNQNQYQYQYQQPTATDDTGSIGWGVLGFFIPIVGLILFLVWNSTKPRNAKSAGIGALVSVILSVVIYIIAGVLFATI